MLTPLTRQEAQAICRRATILSQACARQGHSFWADAYAHLAVAADAIDAHYCRIMAERQPLPRGITRESLTGPEQFDDQQEWPVARLQALSTRCRHLACPAEATHTIWTTWFRLHYDLHARFDRLHALAVRQQADRQDAEQPAPAGPLEGNMFEDQPTEPETTQEATDAPTGAD